MSLKVDAIFVISAKHSNRRKLTTQRLHDQNIKFDFYDATMISEDPVKGCFTSHMNLIKSLYKKGYQRALIFEDDVQFIRPLKDDIHKINKFLNKHNWTIFYLGHRPLTMEQDIGPPLQGSNIRPCHSHDAHAYIINLKKFNHYHIKYQPSYIKGVGAIDGLFSIQQNCYCLYPMLCIQDSTMISQIDHHVPSINYQLYAERNVKSRFWSFIGAWNILIHKNHFEKGSTAGMMTLIIPIFAIIILIIILIFFIRYINESCRYILNNFT